MASLIARVRRWWRGRRDLDAYEECEVCGRRARTNVTVGAVTARPGMGGWSGITATWCTEHVPDEHRPAA